MSLDRGKLKGEPKMELDKIQLELLKQVADLEGIPKGAYNLRVDGKSFGRRDSEHIHIVPKTDGKSGIDIYIDEGTKNESVHIPVILDQTGLHDMVYNDFHVGKGADVVIVAGCGIDNCGSGSSEHSGIHSFYLDEGARVKYIEKHYGQGNGDGERIMNPQTVVHLAKDAYMLMETAQIGGIDSTERSTQAKVGQGATLIVHEKIMTHGKQHANTDFEVDLCGEGATTHVVSRSVAKENSTQQFNSHVVGSARCSGRTECDAIIMDNARVGAIPQIVAAHPEAALVHEAAIGRIAGEQLIKLMTLGLTEKEAENEIINGFLK